MHNIMLTTLINFFLLLNKISSPFYSIINNTKQYFKYHYRFFLIRTIKTDTAAPITITVVITKNTIKLSDLSS